jgi:hypothetical protein
MAHAWREREVNPGRAKSASGKTAASSAAGKFLPAATEDADAIALARISEQHAVLSFKPREASSACAAS